MFARKKLLCDSLFTIFVEYFAIGVNIVTRSLANADLNGLQGTVVGYQGDRVVVKLPGSIGEKAFQRKNLVLSHVCFAFPGDDVEVTHVELSGSADACPLRNDRDGHPGVTDIRSDDIGTSTAPIATSQKAEAVEPALQEALQQSEHEALEQEQADVAQAILESIREAPVGVVLRLTHHDEEVRRTLMTTTVLSKCRSRVTDVGCDLSPAWGNGAMFLIPFLDESKFQELQLQGIGLENLKPYNIVALRDDEDLIVRALAQVPRRRRPRCKHEVSDIFDRPEGSGSAGSTSLLPTASEAMLAETGESSDSAPEGHAAVEIVVERTFFTVKQAHASSASCRSAPW